MISQANAMCPSLWIERQNDLVAIPLESRGEGDEVILGGVQGRQIGRRHVY